MAQFTAVARQFTACTVRFIVKRTTSKPEDTLSQPIGHGAVLRSKTVYRKNAECRADLEDPASKTRDAESGYGA